VHSCHWLCRARRRRQVGDVEIAHILAGESAASDAVPSDRAGPRTL
jgi:hypothetical protein